MRRIPTAVLAIGLAALAAAPVFAQPQPGRFGPRTPPGVAQLLGMDKVQTELKITDDQKAAVTKITDTFKDDLTAAGQDRDKRTEVRKKMNDAVVKAVPDVLKADQVKRLNQLVVQAAGLQAFAKDDVATALKLTDDQKKAIKDTTDGLQKDIMDLMTNVGQDADKRTEARTKALTMRTDALDKIVTGLTDDQKKTWKDLTGDKFEFPAPQRGNRQPGATPGNRGTRGNRANRTPPPAAK